MKNIEKYTMIILIFIAVGAIGAAVYFGVNADKDNSKKKENKQEEILEKNEDSVKENGKDIEIVSKKCFGKYYGEASGKYKNGISYNYKYTFNLEENGTYNSVFGLLLGDNGTYDVSNGIISFKHQVDVGPEGEMYIDKYQIADDCSYFIIPIEDEQVLKLELQK